MASDSGGFEEQNLYSSFVMLVSILLARHFAGVLHFLFERFDGRFVKESAFKYIVSSGVGL